MLVKKLLLGAALTLLPLAGLQSVASAAPALPAGAPGVVAPGAVLAENESAHSPNGRYTLVQQSDGNLVLYSAPNRAEWDTGTQGAGVKTVMQADGNLVVYSAASKPLFDTATAGHPGAALAVQDDGNLVIYAADGAVLWSRHMWLGKLPAGRIVKPGDQVRSMDNKYHLDMQTDGNLVLYTVPDNKVVWNTVTAANPGARAQMQADGNFVVVSAAPALKPLWNSQTGGRAGADSWLGVQDDGNVVVYNGANKPLWSSKTGVVH